MKSLKTKKDEPKKIIDEHYSTAAILDTLVNVGFKYNIFFINLLTLIRNNLRFKEDNTLFKRVLEDCETLYNCFIYTEPYEDNRNTYVLFYIPYNYYVKEGFKENLSDLIKRSLKYSKEFYSVLEDNKIVFDKHLGNNIVEYKKVPPNESIVDFLKSSLVKEQETIGSIADHSKKYKALMLSHISFDWFLAFESGFIEFNFIESYTGKIYDINGLSKKLLEPKLRKIYPNFSEYLPFTKITHVLFGDVNLVKGALTYERKVKLIDYFYKTYPCDLYIWKNDPSILYSDVHKLFQLPQTILKFLTNEGGTPLCL
jgi:hypothetical protein